MCTKLTLYLFYLLRPHATSSCENCVLNSLGCIQLCSQLCVQPSPMSFLCLPHVAGWVCLRTSFLSVPVNFVPNILSLVFLLTLYPTASVLKKYLHSILPVSLPFLSPSLSSSLSPSPSPSTSQFCSAPLQHCKVTEAIRWHVLSLYMKHTWQSLAALGDSSLKWNLC